MTLPAQLRQRRIDLGLSQSELSRRSGIRRAAINRFEHGKQNMTIGLLGRIVATLGGKLSAEWSVEFPADRA